jgi:hypothetical protein
MAIPLPPLKAFRRLRHVQAVEPAADQKQNSDRTEVPVRDQPPIL